jgi:hypothetical protein
MKYLKKFETLYKNYKDDNYYLPINISSSYINIISKNELDIQLLSKDLLEIIGVNIDDKNDWICKYNIDVIKFLKEIFLKKEITFYSKSQYNAKWYSNVKIYDVNLNVYNDEIYISVKIKNDHYDWEIIDNSTIVTVYNYDASNKSEHQKLKQFKKAEKYNL